MATVTSYGAAQMVTGSCHLLESGDVKILGRKIVDSAEHIYVRGEKTATKAKIHTINRFSAHGDRGKHIYV